MLNSPILSANSGEASYTVHGLEESLGPLLSLNNKEGKENALYYISRRLIGAESHYSTIEKHCLSLIFVVQKLCHYMLSHRITMISKDRYVEVLDDKTSVDRSSSQVDNIITAVGYHTHDIKGGERTSFDRFSSRTSYPGRLSAQ
ncbi:hypothetical protein MA16_Dca028646 [Dendrobium catenatum]|uniref:Reverse transcriptase RNase H-like domain-containing protein n=1 Tax=Dendrobium catenatum TaxID=906689 RepID=A0A2I0VBL4_9ASPA|nr:hypothetical protein MA16_Dca028646 [Dendrobium catenatum]